MAYIPENHWKYNLLPYSACKNRECCEYESRILYELEKMVGSRYDLVPYNITSIKDYLNDVDAIAKDFPDNVDVKKLLEVYKDSILDLNDKNCWSILRYICEDDELSDLTPGKCYYWPCSKRNPEFRGVIDDEEFTAYLYPANKKHWEILEDPSGMAERTINECGLLKFNDPQ